LTRLIRLNRLAAPILLSALVASCDFFSQPTPPLPPLLRDATTTGGANFLCETDEFREAMGEGSTPETASHSPEISARLEHSFPVGSDGSALRDALLAQGFEMLECAPDPTIHIARFDQTGGNGVTTMSAMGIVFWKTDADGKIVWTIGDISYRGL
jgi:hypothetical protein